MIDEAPIKAKNISDEDYKKLIKLLNDNKDKIRRYAIKSMIHCYCGANKRNQYDEHPEKFNDYISYKKVIINGKKTGGATVRILFSRFGIRLPKDYVGLDINKDYTSFDMTFYHFS